MQQALCPKLEALPEYSDGPVSFNSRSTSFTMPESGERPGSAIWDIIGALVDTNNNDDNTLGYQQEVLSFRDKTKLYSLDFTEKQVYPWP